MKTRHQSHDGATPVSDTNEPQTDGAGRLPEPPPGAYPCNGSGCGRNQTWPPEKIRWSDGQTEPAGETAETDRPRVAPGWYCGKCISRLKIAPTGPRLDDVLRANGRHDILQRDHRGNPACTECAFYAINAKASTDDASRRLLESTHGINDTDCCHPTSLIVRGNGEYDSAQGMRRGWCGHGAMLFTAWPTRQKQRTVRGRVLEVKPVNEIGKMQKVRIALDTKSDAELEHPLGTTTVKRIGLTPGTSFSAKLSHTPNGSPHLDEWETGDRKPSPSQEPGRPEQFGTPTP